ncbi:hypothetical protein [Geodermatophilus sp. URMC 64]
MADELSARLQALADLHVAGTLTAEEFAAAKTRVLEEAAGAGPVAHPAGGPSAGRLVGHGGAVTAGAGGVLTLLAFLAFPLGTVPFFGSITAASLAGMSSEVGELGLLWLIPLIAVAVAGTGAWLAFAAPPGEQVRRASTVVAVLAGVVVLVYVVALVAVQSELSDSGATATGMSAAGLAGAGFWFALLGMAAAAIGAVVEKRTRG